MNFENLARLSFEQLTEMQQCISTAINEKKSLCVRDATSDIIDFLALNHSDIDLWEIVNELAFRSHIQINRDSSFILEHETKEEISTTLESLDNPDFLLKNARLLSERLKTIRNSVLQNDDSRLLWLTNGGIQKTSNMFGKELAEILQETIKKLERLDSLDEDDEKIQDLSMAVKKIDEWAEFKLGLSLLNGTLTVINPFSSRQHQDKGDRGLSKMPPIAEIRKDKSDREISFPFSHKSDVRRYTNT